MSQYHDTLNRILANVPDQIRALDAAEMDHKPAPAKWSKKEILGHLVDSAYNNHQRFLRAELQGNLIFQGYDPDDWVIKNNYQNRSIEDVLHMWETCNRHLSILVSKLPKDVLQKMTTEHEFHIMAMNLLPEGESSNLSYLIWDYIFHLDFVGAGHALPLRNVIGFRYFQDAFPPVPISPHVFLRPFYSTNDKPFRCADFSLIYLSVYHKNANTNY